MSNQVRIRVNTTQNPRVDISAPGSADRRTVRTVGVGSSSATELVDLTDVDADDLQDGYVLTYNSTSGMFVIQRIELISGGNF